MLHKYLLILNLSTKHQYYNDFKWLHLWNAKIVYGYENERLMAHVKLGFVGDLAWRSASALLFPLIYWLSDLNKFLVRSLLRRRVISEASRVSLLKSLCSPGLALSGHLLPKWPARSRMNLLAVNPSVTLYVRSLPKTIKLRQWTDKTCSEIYFVIALKYWKKHEIFRGPDYANKL